MQLYRKGNATPLGATVTLSTDKKAATLNPTNNLRAGRVYILRLRAGITDLAGNALTATSWQVTAR